MFTKIMLFAKDHKDVLIKAAATIGGAILGMIAVGLVTGEPTEEVLDENLQDLEKTVSPEEG